MMDYTVGDTIIKTFTTKATATGIPATLSGSPALAVYADANTAQITAGVSLSVDHDGVTGLNLMTVVATAANGYAQGSDYSVVITSGTVQGKSMVGETIFSFSLGKSAAAVDLANVTDGLGALKADIAAIPTTTMRGTDGAALASAATEARLAELDPENIPKGIDDLNLGILYGLTTAGTLSTTQCSTDLTGFLNDELVGGVIIFTGGIANGERADITGYTAFGGVISYSGGITTPPAAGDRIKIV